MSNYDAWDEPLDKADIHRGHAARVAVMWMLFGGILSCLVMVGLLRLPFTGRWLGPMLMGPVVTPGSVNIEDPSPSLTPKATVESTSALNGQSTIIAPVIPTSVPFQSPESQVRPSPTTDHGGGGDALLPPGLEDLRKVMLVAINRDRSVAGLGAVADDQIATLVGQAHAEDMLAQGYFSHWNLQGYGPDHRYTLAGGSDAAFENIYMFWYRYENGAAAPIGDWAQLILDAEASLMESPGHRANILDPYHTHVGIGIAYDPNRGELRLAQEFVNRWIEVDLLPHQVSLGDTVQVSGRLLPDASQPLVNLAYQPMPQPYTTETVPQGSYDSATEIFSAVEPQMSGDRFVARANLDEKHRLGLYQIRVWVQIRGVPVLASNRTVWVP